MDKADVRVVMARNNVFPWQTAPHFDAVFVCPPNGPGDTYTVEVPGVGRVDLNGNSAEFVAIYALPQEGDRHE